MIRLIYVFLVLLFITSCGGSKEKAGKQSSPRIKKKTSIENPTQNQHFVRGNQVPFAIRAAEDFSVDSVQIIIGDQTQTYFSSSFEVVILSRLVGSRRLITKVYSGGESETHYRTIMILPEHAPKIYTYEIKNTYPHHVEDYTQGLLIKDGYLYESTGHRGTSTLKKKNLTTGKTEKTVTLPASAFGEGLAFVNNEFYQLTWTSGQGFVYNDQMEKIRTFNYAIEGWGLTQLEGELALTDGSEKIYFIDPESFSIQRKIEAYDNKGKVKNLNELEIIDGLIYANVYHEDYIVAIDPDTGEVLRRMDCSGLLTEKEAETVDVLNGIAIDETTGHIYITGKWWPKLFEVTFQPEKI